MMRPFGVLLIFGIVFSLMAVYMFDILYAFAAIAILLVALSYFVTGNGKYLPATRYEIFYAMLLVLLPLAPALGSGGTVARFGVAGAGMFLLLTTLNSPRFAMPRYVNGLILALTVYLTIMALFAPNVLYGTIRGVNWLMFVPVAALFCRRPSIPSVVYGLIASTALQAGGVYFQLEGRYGGTWGGLLVSGTKNISSTVERITRYTGFVLNPNNLGLLFAMTAVVLVVVIVKTPTVSTKILLTLVVLFLLYGTVLTNSRTAIVGLGAGSFVALTFLGLRRVVGLSAATAAVAYVGYASGWSQVTRFVDSFGDIANETDVSYLARVSLWGAKISDLEFLQSIGGGGYGAANPALYERQSGFALDSKAQVAGTVDNSWLKLWIEGGIVSVVIMLAVVATAVVVIYRTRNTDIVSISAGVIGVLVTFLWATFSYDMLDINPWNGVLWLLLGVAFSLQNLTAQPESTSSARDLGGDQRLASGCDHECVHP